MGEEWSGSELWTRAVGAQMRAEIEGAGGAEVFFYGDVDEGGVVVKVHVASRGHEGAAPAVLSRSEGRDVAIHNHPSGVLRPSDADLEVASALGERGLGFYVIDNAAERGYVVVPVGRRRREVGVEGEEVEALLGPGGPVARSLGGRYEARAGQVSMARSVGRALSEGRVALLEAGTGTGKTFAYLVPAGIHALRNEGRVVVSTATIHLQEQISRQDVPRVADALAAGGVEGPEGGRLRAVVVKGRGNYVSLRRAEEAGQREAAAFASDAEQEEVQGLVEWSRRTRTGDRGELSPVPGRGAWEHVSSQADNCLGSKCKRFRDCHYFAARRAAGRAEVVIVNHHLLFSDVAIKRDTGFDQAAVLPPFERVVLDEGHHVESIASEHFGVQVTGLGLAQPLGRLQAKRDKSRGLLPGVCIALGEVGGLGARLVDEVERYLLPLRDRAARQLREALGEVARRARAALPVGEQTSREVKLRLRPETEGVLDGVEVAREALELLAGRLKRWVEELDVLPREGQERVEGLAREVKAVAKRLERQAVGLKVVQTPDEDVVRWVELRWGKGGDTVALKAVPLEVGPLLREALFDKVRTAVLTSATLTVGGRFDFVESRLGLVGSEHAEGALRAQIASPFDYRRQAVLALPLDLPDPDQPAFEGAAAAAIRACVLRSRGRAFVLFTSYGALRRAHERLAGELEREGLLVLRQGAASRGALLEQFRATGRAVLFGTDSFWEGVDVPGEALVLVVIARLPFRVPTDPVEQARAESVRRRGGDPFRELQLPVAVLKLTQGFGRLIRSRTDRGAVVVLDKRIRTRWYGRMFLESLPPVGVVWGPLASLWGDVEPLIAPGGSPGGVLPRVE